MSGTIYSVNDVSGIPSIEVLDTGLVKIAQYSGNVVLGSATDTGTAKLQVTGAILATGTIMPQSAATASAPAYVKGAIYFDTTLNKLRVGGASGWETVTSA
jgi:hypothetical protein